MQSTGYAEWLQRQGYTPNYFHIIYDSEMIGQCSILINQNNVGTWSYGPVLRDSCPLNYSDVVSELLQYLEKMGVIGVENVTTQVMYNGSCYEANNALYSEIRETPFVDLQRNIEETYRLFDRSVRKNVRKCETAGVDVFITNDPSALDPYLEMLSSHRSRLGLAMPPFYPNHETKRMFSRPYSSMDLALASINGKYLAGLGFIVFGKIVIEVAVAQSDAYLETNLPAHDLIKVRAVETYGKQGVKYYDLMGVKKRPSNQKEQNIRRFKLKFSKSLAEFATINDRGLAYLPYLKYRFVRKCKRIVNRLNRR
jgi:hypothetical protein